MDAKYRILIVDDDRTLCSIFKEGLMDAGCYCQTALNGKSALDTVSARQFDVMVTDIIMPGMDGLELTYKVKQLKPEIAVIVMTGFQQDESYERAVGFGASDFIKKPFTIPELLTRIERVMRDRGILDEIRKKQEEVRTISRDMIAGIQDESTRKIAELEQEILRLRKKLS